jgi:hypothetical protein
VTFGQGIQLRPATVADAGELRAEPAAGTGIVGHDGSRLVAAVRFRVTDGTVACPGAPGEGHRRAVPRYSPRANLTRWLSASRATATSWASVSPVRAPSAASRLRKRSTASGSTVPLAI